MGVGGGDVAGRSSATTKSGRRELAVAWSLQWLRIGMGGGVEHWLSDWLRGCDLVLWKLRTCKRQNVGRICVRFVQK